MCRMYKISPFRRRVGINLSVLKALKKARCFFSFSEILACLVSNCTELEDFSIYCH